MENETIARVAWGYPVNTYLRNLYVKLGRNPGIVRSIHSVQGID